MKDVICGKIGEFVEEVRGRGFGVDFDVNTNAPVNRNTVD